MRQFANLGWSPGHATKTRHHRDPGSELSSRDTGEFGHRGLRPVIRLVCDLTLHSALLVRHCLTKTASIYLLYTIIV